jgi:hypothetical protein
VVAIAVEHAHDESRGPASIRLGSTTDRRLGLLEALWKLRRT